MKYRAGYKYQLAEPYRVQTAITPQSAIVHDFIVLTVDGILTINAGYAWNGCSGPTYDDKTNMRASLVHDSLYQLEREGLLDLKWRETADKEFYRICKEDGMNAVRAWYYFKAVRMAGESSARPQADKILEAP